MSTKKSLSAFTPVVLAAAAMVAFSCSAGVGKMSEYGVAPSAGLVDALHAETPGALPTFHPGRDELWVFAEAPAGHTPQQDPDAPRSGSMVARGAAGAVLPVPLRHTEVKASVRGYLATVDLKQQFHNPYAEKIEACYVFPLPDDAAVREFVLTIGERQIRGIVREKQEAQRIYEQARAQGLRAALLDQARPNVFEQSVANIEPGKAIDVQMRYFHTLAYASGSYEFVFPMVVGPRYNPPGWSEGIGAVAVGEPGRSGQPTEVAYLPPGTSTASTVSVAVDVDAGMPLVKVASPSHDVAVERRSPSCASVRLAAGETARDRDFVLRITPEPDACHAALLSDGDDNGGYLTMLVQPPVQLRDLPRQPLELVFVLDCSGSMSGAPLEQCKATVEMALQHLGPADSFRIIRFSNTAGHFVDGALPATRANVARGIQFVRSLDADGGTEMMTGMRAALDGPSDPERLRFVAFLTDGFIGNERQVFDLVRRDVRDSRVFSLGVGSSVNRYLLEGIARLGRGAVGYLLHDEAPGHAVSQLFERIGHPALLDVEVDWGGAQVDEVFPRRMPDLFAGRPVVLTARYRGAAPSSVRVRGKVGGRVVEIPVPCQAWRAVAGEAAASEGNTGAAVLPAVWARRKIQSLSDFAALEGREAESAQVRDLALTFGLMSQYTSFVAVDASGRTAGDRGFTVQVPVPMPAGVEYSTTVGDR